MSPRAPWSGLGTLAILIALAYAAWIVAQPLLPPPIGP